MEWYTRHLEGVVPLLECGFESHLSHKIIQVVALLDIGGSGRVTIRVKIYGSVPSVSSKHEKRNWMKMWVQIPSEPLK